MTPYAKTLTARRRNAIQREIDAAFSRHASHTPIPVMKLGDISRAGWQAHEAGRDVSEAVRQAVVNAAVTVLLAD